MVRSLIHLQEPLKQRLLQVKSNINYHVETLQDIDIAETTQVTESLCAAILFNFALLHHRYGMVSGQDAALHRSSGLYLTLIDMVQKDTTTDAAIPWIDNYNCITAIQTVALNNLSHIQYELCHYDACNQCLFTLDKIFEKMTMIHFNQFIVLGHVGNNINQNLSFDDVTINSFGVIGEIRMNLLLWTIPSAAKAA